MGLLIFISWITESFNYEQQSGLYDSKNYFISVDYRGLQTVCKRYGGWISFRIWWHLSGVSTQVLPKEQTSSFKDGVADSGKLFQVH